MTTLNAARSTTVSQRQSNLIQEEALCSALLASPETISRVYDLCSWQDFSDARTRLIAEAIWSCHENQPTPMVVNYPNVHAMLQQLGFLHTHVSEDYLSRLDDRGTNDIIAGAQDYAERINRLARARKLYHAGRDLLEDLAKSPDEVDSLAKFFVERATPVLTAGGRLTRSADTRSIRTTRKDTEALIIPTGLKALDETIKGFGPKRVLGIAAKQGGRKTTTAINLVLAPVIAGASVSYFSLRDNTREEIYDQFIAMRATSLMRHWHETGHRKDAGPEHWKLSPEGLRIYHNSPAQHDAIKAADDEFDGYRLRIFDSSDGIIDLPDALRVAQNDYRLHKPHIIVIDYMQAFSVEGVDDDYKTMRTSVKKWHQFIAEHDLGAILISQLNKADDVRGGGDLRDACRNLFFVGYSHEHPDALSINLDKVRFGALDTLTYAINPSSGLILNPAQTEGL